MWLSGCSSTNIETVPDSESRDDLAEITNTTADDNAPREDSTVENKQVEDVNGILSNNIVGSNEVHDNHSRQFGLGAVTRSLRCERMMILGQTLLFIGKFSCISFEYCISFWNKLFFSYGTHIYFLIIIWR